MTEIEAPSSGSGLVVHDLGHHVVQSPGKLDKHHVVSLRKNLGRSAKQGSNLSSPGPGCVDHEIAFKVPPSRDKAVPTLGEKIVADQFDFGQHLATAVANEPRQQLAVRVSVDVAVSRTVESANQIFYSKIRYDPLN